MIRIIHVAICFVFFWSSGHLAVASPEIIEMLKFNADFRYRHEIIKEKSKPDRSRQRIRARIGLSADPTENVRFGFQLASGSDDPVSTNQTMGNGFSTKSIGIDLAYMSIHSTDTTIAITMGKQKLPFYKPGKSELIWDSDLRPEGISYGWKPKFSWVDLRWNISGFLVEKRKTTADSWLLGTDLGLKIPFGDLGKHIGIGVGYFEFTHIKGQDPFFDLTDSFGNTTDGSGKYSNDYRLIEGTLEISFPVWATPTSIFLDYVTNTAADKNNQGWLAGFSLGKVKEPGDVAFRYNYRRLEKDAVLGVFFDSDFNKGNTNGKGHEVSVAVGILEKVKTSLTVFVNSTGLDKPNNYYRGQADLSLKF